MLKIIEKFVKRPALNEKSTEKFWDHPHISKGMLEAHLNPKIDSATRNLDFIKVSVDWIAAAVPSARFPRLLDLGCGPGIYAELFQDKGYQVTGLDLSERSIQYASNSAEDKHLDIHYLTSDYVQSPIPGEYDLVTMIYCDFGALLKEERTILLKKIYDILPQEGCFLFDVFTPFEYEGREEFKVWDYEEKGFWRDQPHLLLHSYYRYDSENTFLNQYIVSDNENTVSYNIWEHTFTIGELKEDLKEAGFAEFKFYGNVAGEEWSTSSKLLCAMAQK